MFSFYDDNKEELKIALGILVVLFFVGAFSWLLVRNDSCVESGGHWEVHKTGRQVRRVSVILVGKITIPVSRMVDETVSVCVYH